MKKEKEKFIKGCLLKGYSKKTADDVFALIEKFVGYGFNKSHSASYGMIAYQTAYMKTHYPVEFMTALLTAESRGSSGPTKNEKIAQAVAECKKIKISVLPPDINKSESEFTIENKKSIRFGLSAIKNVGEAAIETILNSIREGEFTSFENFCTRVDLSKVNKKTLESLIKSGAMDHFGKRTSLLISLPETVDKLHKIKKQQSEGQSSLFGDDSPDDLSTTSKNNNIDDFSQNEKLGFEKEFLGIYLTSHPQIENLLLIKSAITQELSDLAEEQEGTGVKVGGIIESIRKIITKKQSEMAFMVLGNEAGITIECIVFPRVYEQYKKLLLVDTIIVVLGKIDLKNDRPMIIVDKIFPASQFSS